jgi:hypothetical protein
MTEQIFISYSKKNSDFAHQLAHNLEAALMQFGSIVEGLGNDA